MEIAWQSVEGRYVLGIPVLRWAVFHAIAAGLFLLLALFRSILRTRLIARAARTNLATDACMARLLDGTWTLSLLAGSAWMALSFVELRSTVMPWRVDLGHTVYCMSMLILFLQVGSWGTRLIDAALEQGFRYAKFREATAQTAIGVVRFFAMAALWTSVAILILSILGIEVTPLLAGLGVGGIAAGFALQRILGDIFCSVAIVLDRPFEVGDLIETGEYAGRVERIGVKTTRVRGVGGEQIVFANSDLLQSRIRNLTRMAERRVAFLFGVNETTPVAVLEHIPKLLRTIVDGIEQTRFDRAHFTAFGSSAFTFELVYFVLDPDLRLAMDVQQRINLGLVRALVAEGVRFTPST